MSHPGVRSSRGDAYQTCIALQWVIQLIEDSSISWIEVDSTRAISTGVHIPVDDVVVGYVDGRETCCQCKKNQPKFNVWTIDELAGELVKAATHLVAEPGAEVRFYARADFGSLLQIRERARVMSDATSFAAGMPAEQEKEVAKLHAKWVEALGHEQFTVYDLIKRIQFVLTKDVDDLLEELSRLLATKVTQGQAAFNALWTRLDLLGARVQANGPSSAAANSHRITRDEVLRLLKEHGCFVAPPMAEIDIAGKLAAMSAIGRAWRRDVAGHRIDRAAVDVLETAAQQSAKVLLTDGPGAGKTCVLLNLAERLEARPGIASLFIQAREFADATTAAERESLGLAPDLVALVSAMSQFRRVAVVMDSLDVLSLARNNLSLIFFLGLIDQLSRIPNVCVIAACRSFDLQYDKRLAARHWDQTVVIGALDWEVDVVPTLQALAIPPENIEDTTRELITNPRNLALFADIAQRSLRTHFHAAQELTEAYLDIVIGDDAELGSEAMVAIERLAGEMVSRRRLQLPRIFLAGSEGLRSRLLSANVLFEGQHRSLGFGHQTLLDALAVRDAERRGLTLLSFIESLQPVPFVRPAVRAYFTHLRLGDKAGFREQVRAVFAAPIAFHIKRLIAESIAALSPEEDDWPLIRHLFKTHPEHFESLYYATSGLEWHLFWMKHFVPLVSREGDMDWKARHLVYASKWVDADPKGVFALFDEWANTPSEDGIRPRTVIIHALRSFKRFSEVDAYPLLKALVASSAAPDWLGSTLINWAKLDSRGDQLLWEFVAAGVPDQPTSETKVEETLNCGQKSFVKSEQFPLRMASSDVLLDLALNAIEVWAASIASHEIRRGLYDPGPNTVFVDATSFGADRQRALARHGSALIILMEGFEKAVLIRAKSSASWWNVNGRRICLNDCGGLRHIGNVVMTQFPEANLDHLRDYFANEDLLLATSPPQLRILIRAAATLMEAPTLDQIERHVLYRHHDKLPGGALWLDIDRYELLSAVPAGLRSEGASLAFDDYSQRLPLPSWHPASTATRDSDYSNFKGAVLIGLSDGALVELMGREPTFPSFLGGLESFKERLRSIASSCPRRFLTLLAARWSEISDASREAILDGATGYMRCRYGDLSDARWEPMEEVPAVELANLLLDELDRHPSFWRHDKVACKAILACSGQIQDPRLVDRLLFLSSGFANSPDPACDERHGDDMLTTAINCSRGLLARALVDMANGLIEAGILDLPPLLKSTLLRLANDCHPAVRVEIMRNLTFMQTRLHLGWELFDLAFTDADDRVWVHADRPFYYGYAKEFDRVRPYLVRMQTSSRDAVLEIWGRISALASLAGHVSQAGLEAALVEMNSKPAWEGATRVWAANMRHMEFRNACEEGMGLAMQHVSGRNAALMHFSEAFEITESVAKVPLGLMRSAFSNVNGSDIAHQMNGVDDWLCAIADVDLDHALAAAEIAAAACKELGQSPFYDEEIVGTLLTALFREAEEREESDSGEMIKRVVALQDIFLSIPGLQLGEWLRAAERPGN